MINHPLRDQVHHLPLALMPYTVNNLAFKISLRCFSSWPGQTITLAIPVSSSRVTKSLPLAVSGRCRIVTRPVVRVSFLSGNGFRGQT
jgi:hypothetical protein